MTVDEHPPERKRKSSSGVFSGVLRSGESILWEGQPDPNRHLNRRDTTLIPYSLLQFAAPLAMIWMFNTFFTFFGSFGTLYNLLIGFFLVTGLYALVGRFAFKYFKKRNTYYAVTEDRIIIHDTTPLFGNTTTLYIDQLTELNRDGADIMFASPSAQPSFITWGGNDRRRHINASNTGMEPLAWMGYYSLPGFYDLDDPDYVYDMIQYQRYEAKTKS